MMESSSSPSIKAGELKDNNKKLVTVEKKCENIGVISVVEVTQNTDDVWLLEYITVEAPEDLTKPDKKTSITFKVPQR